MAKLTTKARKTIPAGKFALPGRRYPIEDKSHARNALARVAQHGSSSEKAEVRAKVRREYPGIGKSDKGKEGAMKKSEMKKGSEKKRPKDRVEHEEHKAIGGQHGHMMGMKDCK